MRRRIDRDELQPRAPASVLLTMVRRARLVLALVLAACGDAGPGTSGDAATTGADGSSDPSGPASDVTTDDADSSEADASTASETGTTGTASSDVDASSGDDTSAAVGPVELYRGPVVGGVISGWDADAPRPLVMLGREGDDWLATLARIDETGALSENVAAEIIVWGWDDAPPLLYDGPVVGGAIPGWTPDDPTPVVMLAQQAGDTAWFATLAQIAADGGLSENVAERIVVWGWAAGTADAPALRYAGPIDANAVLPGWDPDMPAPLVMLGRVPIVELWVSTLARVAPDGTLSDNFATELRVWGW